MRAMGRRPWKKRWQWKQWRSKRKKSQRRDRARKRKLRKTGKEKRKLRRMSLLAVQCLPMAKGRPRRSHLLHLSD